MKISFLSVCAFLLTFLTVISPACAQINSPTLLDATPIMESVRPQLQGTVDVLLPTQLPYFSGGKQLEASLSSVSDTGYIIRIHNAGCNAGACSYGSLAATRLSSNVPPLDTLVQQYQADSARAERRSRDSAGEVSLKGDRTGYFFPWYGTGNVNEAVIVYEQNNVRYRFGIKGGSKENLITLTNSAF